jgi:hypothetical protein
MRTRTPLFLALAFAIGITTNHQHAVLEAAALAPAVGEPTNPNVFMTRTEPDTVGAGGDTVLIAGVLSGTEPASTGLTVTVTTDAIGIPGTGRGATP